MVLTNFEFWAADASSMPSSFETTTNHHHTRHLNPFDPRVVPSRRNMTHHLSSNGYYGFSYINAAHDLEELNNNNNNNTDSTNNNNNNTTTYNFMANDVNGMNTPTAAEAANTVPAAGNAAAVVSRCKKRFFVVNDCSADGGNKTKRRKVFDDDFAAQYCNDFFSLPSTQIATQSCLMDTEEGIPNHQTAAAALHQQQVDVAMFENNNNSMSNNNNNNNVEKYEQSILHHQLQQQPQQTEMQTHQPPTPQQQQEQQQQHPYHHQQHHHQQHYQDMPITTATATTTITNSTNTQPLAKTLKTHESATVRYLQNSVNIHSDVDVDADFKIDDATLFAQIHGGCFYHFIKTTTT